MLDALSLDLPFPPSLHAQYKYVRSRVVLSQKGREWRERVVSIVKRKCKENRFKEGARLSLIVRLHAPDRRKRDLDNFCGKALQDALQASRVFKDDSQIDYCSYYRGEIDKADPRVHIKLTDLDTIDEQIEEQLEDDGETDVMTDPVPIEALFVSMGMLAEVLLDKAPKDIMAYEEACADPDFPGDELTAFLQLSETLESEIYKEDVNPLGLGLESVRKLHENWRQMYNWSLN